MNRRDFIILLTCSVTASPIAARAQEPGKVRRIGFLRVGPKEAVGACREAGISYVARTERGGVAATIASSRCGTS